MDTSVRGEKRSAWKGRSKGWRRGFLAFGGWRRGATACTTGYTVRFGCHTEQYNFRARDYTDYTHTITEAAECVGNRRIIDSVGFDLDSVEASLMPEIKTSLHFGFCCWLCCRVLLLVLL